MGGRAPLTQQGVVDRARKVHGNKYVYPRLNYKPGLGRATVTCRAHGDFELHVQNLFNGQGCPECAKTVRANKRRLTQETFIARARLAHGDQYDYSRVKYRTLAHKVDILCPQHGVFKQRPGNHIAGKEGCPKCKPPTNVRATVKDFVRKARAVHGGKYDYTKVNYVNARTKVLIGCPDHGVFSQLPDNHTHGNGCPTCKFEKVSIGRNFNRKQVRLPNGDKVTVLGFEHYAIAILLQEQPRRKLKFGKDVPVISYEHEGKTRRYYPDVRYGKTLVEVKSTYTWFSQQDQNRAKLRAANSAGYTVRLLVLDEDANVLVDREVSADGKVTRDFVNLPKSTMRRYLSK